MTCYGCRCACLLALLLSLALLFPAALCAEKLSSSFADISTVHVIVSNHLDVGFNTVGTTPWKFLAADVVDEYFRTYFPRALTVAQELRNMQRNGTNPHNYTLTWTTHPFLVSLYFSCPPHMGFYCPTAQEQQAVLAGIQRKEITWHAFPFNGEMELFSADLLEFAINLSRDLALSLKRPGPLPNTISQRDVPGTTRAVIPHLHATGIRAMSVGVNFGSAPVVVPSISRWSDIASNTSIFLLYHGRGYGGIANVADFAQADGFEHALGLDWRGDNAGPPSPSELINNFDAVQKLWPGRKILMSTFETFITLLDQAVTLQQQRSAQHQHVQGKLIKLLEFTNEMGDTWIHGAGTDPLKVAQWRALSRLRSECVHDPQCPSDSPAFYNFSRLLLKAGEHTWGSDVKQLLRYSDPLLMYEYYHWTNDNLTTLINNNSDYHTLIASWHEQRAWAVDIPLSALPPTHPIVTRSTSAFRAIQPPDDLARLTIGFTRHPLSPAEPISVGALNVTFDPQTGAIMGLIHGPSSTQWASPTHLLGQVLYQTFDESHSFAQFLAEYISFDMSVPGADQYPHWDFGKMGLDASAHPVAQAIRPQVLALYSKVPGVDGYEGSFVLALGYEEELCIKYGAPRVSVLLLNVNASSLSLHYTLINVNKTRTRIPEAGWLSFNPVNNAQVPLHVNKISSWIDLAQPVMGNGSAHLHAISERGVRLPRQLEGRSPDVALVCVGYPPTPFPTPLAKMQGNPGAFSFNLFNNIWGTNYPMWYPFDAADRSQQYRVDIQLIPQTRRMDKG